MRCCGVSSRDDAYSMRCWCGCDVPVLIVKSAGNPTRTIRPQNACRHLLGVNIFDSIVGSARCKRADARMSTVEPADLDGLCGDHLRNTVSRSSTIGRQRSGLAAGADFHSVFFGVETHTASNSAPSLLAFT